LPKKKKHPSQSPRPLTAQEAAVIFARFVRGDIDVGEGKGLVRRLRDGAGVIIPFLLKKVRQGTPAEQDVTIQLLPLVGGQAVKDALTEIARDAEASARARATAMAALHELGVDVDLPALFDKPGEAEKFSRQAMEEMLKTINTDESALEAFVREILGTREADRLETVRSLGRVGDPRILRLLISLLYVRDNRTIGAAIDALETLGAPEAVPALTEISQACPDVWVRKRAREVYGKLAIAAITPADHEREQWRLPRQELPLFKAMVCTIDGDGAQSIIIGRRRPDGRIKAITILFNDHQGVKDCFGKDMLTKREWSEIVRSLEEDGMSWVDIGLTRCRHLIARARAINSRLHRRLPFELEIWSTLLQDGPQAARLWPDEEEDSGGSNERVTDPELLRRTGELLELPEFRSWGFDPRDIDPATLMAFEAIRRSRAGKAKKAGSLNLLIANTLKTLAKPRWRRLVEGRLRRQAWLLDKLGRAEHSRLALAAATALSKESHIPLEEQPLMRNMVVKSLVETYSLIQEYEADEERKLKRAGKVTTIYKFKVSLQDDRGIWRIIEIKGSQTLHALHKAIFSAFDRFEEHLYGFYMNNKPYDEASAYESPYADERVGRDASRTRFDSLGLRPKQKFLYIFDFGDDWRHTVEVLDITEAVPTGKYPRLLEKKGDSPPQYPDIEEDDVS
jgi:hypothetical protein